MQDGPVHSLILTLTSPTKTIGDRPTRHEFTKYFESAVTTSAETMTKYKRVSHLPHKPVPLFHRYKSYMHTIV